MSLAPAVERGALRRPGALRRWREEIAAGVRGKEFDLLHAAACHELAGVQLEAEWGQGDDLAAEHYDVALVRLSGSWLEPYNKGFKEALQAAKVRAADDALRPSPRQLTPRPAAAPASVPPLAAPRGRRLPT